MLVWAVPLLPRGGEGLGLAACVSHAIGLQRTDLAARLLRTADRRAQVHHCLDEVAGPISRYYRFGEVPDFAPELVKGMFQAIIDTAVASQNPRDVGIDRGNLLSEGNRGDRGRSIVSDARQSPKLVGRSGEGAPPRNLSSAGNQIAGPRVVTKPRPFREALLVARSGKCLDMWPARDKTLEPRNHGCDRRLLEHDLAQPDAI